MLVLVPTGMAWIAVIAGLNATTQAFLPDWVRARALAVYQMVLFASFAGSAAPWGAVGRTTSGLGSTFLRPGWLLLVTTVVGIWLPLRRTDVGDRRRSPGGSCRTSRCWAPPSPTTRWRSCCSYRVAAEHQDEFLQASATSGPAGCAPVPPPGPCSVTPSTPSSCVERFRVASWADHRDQHDRRLTPFDHQVVQRAASLAQDVSPATHLLVVPVPHHARHRPRT